VSEPSAKVILDSISSSGHRLTTMEVVMHRFVLAEFNTHRVFSRNSASSRAIPVKKQIQRVLEDPAIPLSWPSERPGMQGGELQSDGARIRSERIWLEARDSAVQAVLNLTNARREPENELLEPLHKSVANRLLEPFMWHTVIVSATEWRNFFGLRCNPLAQPEIRAAADVMRVAYVSSEPKEIPNSEWHMPYIQDGEFHDNSLRPDTLRMISAARCARVSYLTHDGIKSHEADLKLYDQLTSADPPHSSPLEHVATPCATHYGDHFACHLGNFTGWDQLRHMVGK